MFFDIGANIGKWSLANVDNASKIIAIEAVPDTFIKLTNNTCNHSKIWQVFHCMILASQKMRNTLDSILQRQIDMTYLRQC